MGSPLSPVVANIYYTSSLPSLLQTKAQNVVMLLWTTLSSFDNTERTQVYLDSFLNHLNSLRPCLQFTMEKNVTIIFYFQMSLLNKEVTTCKHLSIVNPLTQTISSLIKTPSESKVQIVNCLKTRAVRLCSDKNIHEEMHHIEHIFENEQISFEDSCQSYQTIKEEPREKRSVCDSLCIYSSIHDCITCTLL